MKNALKLSLVFLFFCGISLVYTAPLYKYLNKGFVYTAFPSTGNEVVPFEQSDSVQLFYHFWMALDYMEGGPGPFFQDPYEFKVDESGIFTTRRLWISLVYVFLAQFGDVAGYNLLILLCIALNGFMAFILAYHYLRQVFPSLIVGVLYCVVPFSIGQILGGHTNGFILFLIPFILWCLEKGFSTGRSFYFLFSALGYLCFSFIEYHLLYYVFMLIPLFFLFRMCMVRPGWKAFFKASFSLAVAMGIAFAVMMIVKSFEIEGSVQAKERSLRDVSLYSPHWSHFFKMESHYDLEKLIYVGWIPFLLAGMSFFVFGLRKPLFWLYFGMMSFFGILTLGTTIMHRIPLYSILYDHLPYFSLSRVPGRMFVFFILALGMVIALGLNRLKKGRTLLSLCVLGWLLFDYYPKSPAGITLLPPKSEAYEIIQQRGEKILCLPIWPGDSSWSSIYLYYLTLSRVEMVNGYYPVVPRNYLENIFYPLYSMNVGEVKEEQVRLLQKLKVKYIVLHEEAFPGKVSHFPVRQTAFRLSQSPYLKLILKDQTHWLFEILEEPRKVVQEKITTPIGIYLWGKKFKEEKGWLFYPRIQLLPPGKYTATYRLKGQETTLRILGNDPVLREEYRYLPAEVLVEKKRASGVTQVEFQLDKAMLLTVQLEKKEGVDVDLVLITQAEEARLPAVYEAEDLFTKGRVIEDPVASLGLAVYGTKETMGQTELIYGPYRYYDAGDYQIRFWMKREEASLSPETLVAYLESASEYGRKIIFKEPLLAKDLSTEYRPVEVLFHLDQGEVLEFRIPYLRHCGLYVDRIEVRKGGG